MSEQRRQPRGLAWTLQQWIILIGGQIKPLMAYFSYTDAFLLLKCSDDGLFPLHINKYRNISHRNVNFLNTASCSTSVKQALWDVSFAIQIKLNWTELKCWLVQQVQQLKTLNREPKQQHCAVHLWHNAKKIQDSGKHFAKRTRAGWEK